MDSIQNGIDIVLQNPEKYKKYRIAFVTNDAATTASGIQSRVALIQNGFQITKLFSPEHGIYKTGEDGAAQENGIDAVTKLPVISLYGSKLMPSEADLQDIDMVFFDIPDVGCRFYTYLWTMTYVMEACNNFNKPLIILDRPNPIGGRIADAEGPFLDEEFCSSFIGRWRIPIKHSCTLGELALYFAALKFPSLHLEIIQLKNYTRNFSAINDFKFVPTSPAIQNIETAMLYPGMGLLEGINVNEGRGTDFSFTVCGAPWINSKILKQEFELKNMPGISTIEIEYNPENGLYKNEKCKGIQFKITDPTIIKPVEIGIALIQILLKLYPKNVLERLYKTAANPSGDGHLDKLLGIQHAFEILKSGKTINTNIGGEWKEMIGKYLLY